MWVLEARGQLKSSSERGSSCPLHPSTKEAEANGSELGPAWSIGQVPG